MNPVPVNLSLARRRAGLSQAALARAALITRPNLSAIETGRRDLTVGTLCRIAAALHLPPHLLLMPPPKPRVSLGRFALDAVARAAISGRRHLRPERNELAAGIAWACRPTLLAAGARGARHASRRGWYQAMLVVPPDQLAELQRRVNKLVQGDADVS